MSLPEDNKPISNHLNNEKGAFFFPFKKKKKRKAYKEFHVNY